nr:NAD(P)/FAD-dependent oxidoreductase [Lachnospiraceae bacterium]
MTDVIIIGAGVVGACIARELSRQERSIMVLEKAADVCEGTSKANSGIVHGGYDAKPGTLKAKLNIEGSRMMEALSVELDFPYKRNGALVLAKKDDDMSKLKELYDRGITNGVEGLKIISKDELNTLEPNISDDMEAALYVPSSAIVDPFLLTIAMAENAAVNGVEFKLESEVTAIEKTESGYRVIAKARSGNEVSYECKFVINAAGVYADKIHEMISSEPMHIEPVRGEYCLFDKEAGGYISHTLFRLPTDKGKGVLLTPTAHGNLMAGPTADRPGDPEAVNTTAKGLSDVLSMAADNVKALPAKKVITSFSGLRAQEKNRDFIIKEAEDAKGFIDVAGIESPGLSAAPAIGVYVAELLQGIEKAGLRSDFIAKRKGIPSIANASDE